MRLRELFIWWLYCPGCFLSIGCWWPLVDLKVLSESMSPLDKAVHLSNIPSGQTLDDSLAAFVYLRLCVWVRVCVCVLDGGQAMPTQPTPSLSLSFPSLSPLHFHVYRLGLMVCILTISVWKPADSPALWAWQGCRFIREGGSYLLHQFSWYKFAIFLFGYVAVRQMHSHFHSAGAPVLIPVHNTAAATELSG